MTFHLHEIVDCITQIRGVYRQTGDHNFLHMTRSDKGVDRVDYRIKWILQTAMAMTVFYTILWFYFPRVEVVEKQMSCPSLIPEIVCGPPRVVEKFVTVPCHNLTK